MLVRMIHGLGSTPTDFSVSIFGRWAKASFDAWFGTTVSPVSKSWMWATFRKKDLVRNFSDSSATTSGSTTSGKVSRRDFFTRTPGEHESCCIAVWIPNESWRTIIPIATYMGTANACPMALRLSPPSPEAGGKVFILGAVEVANVVALPCGFSRLERERHSFCTTVE
ncbi:hypothetical protein CDL15_Pgr025970 [Punica granatum]|uniref:Uncharacterized protein n=1 Tax=Punica granatum TaxID=22663 RepID=A0A218WCQ7_PUNGR|nr:hypothetical protein CDL15_Pgr025970 [Punica granatum]